MATTWRRVAALCAVLAGAGAALPETAEAWLDPADPNVLVALDTEDAEFNYGTAPQSSSWMTSHGKGTTSVLYGWFGCTALRFDLAGHRGKIVAEAELHLAKADSDPNFALVAATINADWHEGSAASRQTSIGSPCWRWRITPNPANPYTGPVANEWTFPYSDFSTASFGSYGSLVCYGYRPSDTFGDYTVGSQKWLRMKLDPALVQALILDQYGLAVTDARICYHAEYDSPIYTKEAGAARQPRLYIRFATATDTTPPEAVSGLAAEAGPENGEVVLRFLAPTDPEAAKAFGYNVRYSTGGDFGSATDIARWRIPRPKAPGALQRVLIEDLPPGATYMFHVQAYDAAGNGSAVQSVTFTLPPAVPTPVLATGPYATPNPAGKTVRTVGNVLRYWVASEVAKTNPATGNRMEDGYTGSGSDNYKKANAVWDAATNTISLTACRNEVVAAQLVLQRLGTSLKNVQVTVSDLVNVWGETIPAATHVELFQLHYVPSGSSYYPDAAIPLFAPFPTSFNIPDANHNPGGVNQSVWMDLYVPKEILPGEYTGTVTVQADELPSPVTIQLKVRVHKPTIPDYPTFLVDLNGYGNPWDFGTVDLTCLRYFQAAHKHRAMCNTLPYGQAGAVRPDRAPTLAGTGPNVHADDWSAFDARYGRFFDGTAFLPDTPGSPYYGPGMGTAITHLYTPIFESWPIHNLDPVYGFDAAGLGGAHWNNLVDTDNYMTFFTGLPDIHTAYPDGYKQGVRNVVADWFRHAHEKGWTQTSFQIYLNHKYYHRDYGDCAALWILEENESAEDFRATGWFHYLYRQGQADSGVSDVKWHFRIDISTRWCQNWGQLNNAIDYYMMSAASVVWHWPQTQYRNYHLEADRPEQWNWYGGSTRPTNNGYGYMNLFLQRWCQGLTGGLPHWNNYGASWNSSDELCTVYSGQNVPGFGKYDGPIMSTRVKLMRQAEQVIELLNLWAGADGMNRQRARDGVYARHGSGTWDYAFGGWNEDKVYRLRSDLVSQLEQSLFAVGDIDGDGHVNVFDIFVIAEAWNTQAGDPTYNPICDLDGDGAVYVYDIIVLAEDWGT